MHVFCFALLTAIILIGDVTVTLDSYWPGIFMTFQKEPKYLKMASALYHLAREEDENEQIIEF